MSFILGKLGARTAAGMLSGFRRALRDNADDADAAIVPFGVVRAAVFATPEIMAMEPIDRAEAIQKVFEYLQNHGVIRMVGAREYCTRTAKPYTSTRFVEFLDLKPLLPDVDQLLARTPSGYTQSAEAEMPPQSRAAV